MKRTIPLFFAVALVAAACGSAANVVDPEATSDGLVYGTPSVAGVPLAPYPSGGADPTVGAPVPKIVGQGFDGDELTVDPADGTPKVILFLAHWCPHCQNEVPQVQGWIDENGLPTDVEFYSITTSASNARENFPPAEWLSSENWSVPVLVDDEENTVAGAFGLTAFPFWVFVDAEGRVLQRVPGAIDVNNLSGIIAEMSR